jgi:hypothetical protein
VSALPDNIIRMAQRHVLSVFIRKSVISRIRKPSRVSSLFPLRSSPSAKRQGTTANLVT